MYTFTRWVLLPENRSARLAAERVIECVCSPRERREVNPLFLHGPAGTGKTHLVSALAGTVCRRRPDAACRLLTAREFAESLRDPNADHADVDLLVIEDLQHLPSWAVEALVRVLDERDACQEQTVLTASAGPAQLTNLPARLTSRLGAGLVVRLELLSPPSRLAFLQDRCSRRQLAVGRDALGWLAEHVGGSGRQLEGAVARLEALVRMTGRFPDAAEVAAHFQPDADAARPTVERIAQRVGGCFRVETEQLQSRSRLRNALLPRQIGMYLARQLTPLSLQEIGAYFGGRDHSTVLHACRKVEQAMRADAALSGTVRQLQADLA